jgi:hypothetical protein
MPINFPSSGLTANVSTYTLNGRTWLWNGYSWQLQTQVAGYTGSQGYTGSKGDIGYSGSQGIQGDLGYTGSVGPTTAYVFDGGSPTSNYSGGPAFDCGGIN